MQVMTHHDFFDEDIEKVMFDGHENNREIVLREDSDCSLLINKEDVVALAKEFGLIVYERDSNL